jgi:hypothetical protein
MLCPEKKLVSGGNVPRTPFLGLRMRKNALIYEETIDTTGKLAGNAFQPCVSCENLTSLVMLRWI